MKSFSFDNWSTNESVKPFLFFVQSMEEMLFPYGHDSYRVPTLNFHYLCVEIVSSINKIESGIIDKGNMQPLFNELISVFSNDLVAQKLYGNHFDRLFYHKDDKGEYSQNISQLKKEPGAETSLKEIKKTLYYLLDDMEIGDKYLKTLQYEIEQLLQIDSFTAKEAERLIGLSRLLLTELINRGYSQEFVYSQIKETYYSLEHVISDTSLEISTFWEMFSFDKNKYCVTLPLKKTDIKKLLDHFQNVKVSVNSEKMFGDSCRWIIEVEIESLDPEIARVEATSLICLFVSLKQCNSHVSKSYHANHAIVKDLTTGKVYNLSSPSALLSRGCTRSEEQTYTRIGEMIQGFSAIGDKMINAINLHSSAMESRNENNQLLNLWTIVEVLIKFENKNNYSKITQISNTLTTVLNASYIKSLVEQLIFDLQHCCTSFEKILLGVSQGNNDLEKMVALLVLPEYAENKNALINALPCYPLLQYRIEHYSENFSDRTKIATILSNHRKRIEWQIMRIYRNRNMIVHDGTHFPYIDLIVQNLHFYIDTLMDTINYYAAQKYTSLENIYTLLSRKEFEYKIILQEVDNNKKPKPITEHDFVTTVLGNAFIE